MQHNRLLARVGATVALVAALSGSAAYADTGVRATAMGGAYTALASDLAVLGNPAGIGLQWLEFTGNTVAPEFRQIGDLSVIEDLVNHKPDALDMQKLDEGPVTQSATAGLSFGPVALAGQTKGHLLVQTDGDIKTATVAQEKALSIGLGMRVAKLPFGAGDLRVGLAAHMIEPETAVYTLQGDEVSETRYKGSGFSLTAGALAKVTPMVTLGLTAENLAKQIDWEGDAPAGWPSNDPVYRAGVAVQVPFVGVTLAADAGTDKTLRYGAETNLLFNFLSLRVGQTVRKDQPTVTTYGASMNLGPFSVGTATSKAAGTEFDTFTLGGSVRF